MSEDNPDGGGGQATPPAANQRSIDFVYWLFGDAQENTFLAGSIPGDKPLRKIGYYSEDAMRLLPQNERHHVSAGVYPSGLFKRDENQITAFPVIVFDDIGKAPPPGTVSIGGVRIDESEFALLPDQAWRMETSKGCHQYGYAFEPMLTPAEAKFLHGELKNHPVLGKGLHSIGQYFRLPTGTNTKPGQNFPTQLVYIGHKISFREFCLGFGLDPTRASPKPQPSPSGEKASVETLKEIMKLIPNDAWFDDREKWIGILHALKNASDDDPEIRELWIDWDKPQPGKEDAARAWDTARDSKGSASTLRKEVERRYGRDSEEYRKVAIDIAFEEIPGEEGMKAPETPEEKKLDGELDRLLAEIKKLQPVPAHHDTVEDRNWLDAKGKLRGLGSIIASEGLTAPPVVYEPYARGILATIAGLPGKGKSILILQQSLAVACDRGDLIRTGLKLQFPGDVLFFSNEDGLNVMKRRAAAWAQRHGVDLDKPHRVIPLRSNLLRKEGETWKVECLRVLKAILEELRTNPGDVSMIVIDTLTQSISGAEENSARDMPFVMKFMDRLASAFWGTVVFVTHVNKASAGVEERSITWIRGSISIGGAVRAGVLLVGPTLKEKEEFAGVVEDDTVVEYIVKATDGRDGFVACFYRRVFEQVVVRDAVDPTKMIPFTMMLLEPFYPTPTTADPARLRDMFDAIQKACAMGEVRVPSASAKTAGGNSVHHVLNTTIKRACEIVTIMKEMDWLKVIEKKHRNGDYRVIEIV